jgi:hypothetical protein
MAEIKSESVADFFPESVADLLRNQHPPDGKADFHGDRGAAHPCIALQVVFPSRS